MKKDSGFQCKMIVNKNKMREEDRNLKVNERNRLWIRIEFAIKIVVRIQFANKNSELKIDSRKK